jgi:hypothetical protein
MTKDPQAEAKRELPDAFYRVLAAIILRQSRGSSGLTLAGRPKRRNRDETNL